MLRRFSKSLSFRLLLIFLALAAGFVYFSVAALRWVYDTDETRALVAGHLSLHIDYVLNDIGDPPRVERALAITQRVPVDIRISGPQTDWASDPAFPTVAELDFRPADVALSGTASAWLGALDNAEFAMQGNHLFLRIGTANHDIVVSSPKIADAAPRREVAPIIVSVGLTLVLLAYLAVRWLFRPIRDIRYGAARIGQGRFDERIEIIRDDQLGDLARDINTMAADVQGMLDAKRQLLLGISHELRTPLSRLRLAVELIDEQPDCSGIDTAGLRGDLEEMEKIITTLLEAEHLNSRHAQLHLEPVDPHALVEKMLDDFFVRDAERLNVQFEGESRAVPLDEARIVLMLKNLLSNALRYGNEEDGPVELFVEVGPQHLLFRVRDHGPGIPKEQQTRIGEAFFRGDPSRTRKSGGSGLGLYLATLVARAHGGSLVLDTHYTGGASFEVRLPA